MKIYLDGAKFYADQNSRIGEGFIACGHELTDFISCADIIYSNNPSSTRTQIFKDKLEGKLKPNCKIITTILDIPFHIWDAYQKDIPQIKKELEMADWVCSISDFTKKSVFEVYGVDSTVIYNPIKPVSRLDNVEKHFFGAFVGRKLDPNKNCAAAIHALQLLGIPEEKVVMVGAESVGWGNYLGVQSDENLNKVYNSSHFCFCMGEVEGINLPAVESVAAGCIPVINSKLTTRQELFPSSLFPEYDFVQATPQSIAMFLAQFMQDNGKMEEFKERLYAHYKKNLSSKFAAVSVAEKILNIYGQLHERLR